VAPFTGLHGDQLANSTTGRLTWLWQGFLAAGNVMLLTSQWKSGKTTMVAALAARMGQGGTLAGLRVNRGKVALISEEYPSNWYERSQRLHFGDHISFLCRPITGKPGVEQWADLIDTMAHLRQHEGLDLVVIDPLVIFLPGGRQNFADALLGVLM
jgi:RecA-family ATPase